MPPADLATKPAYKSGISRKKRQPAQRTSPNGLVGGVATVFHSATPPIHSCSARSTSEKTGACSTHAPLNSSAAAAKDTSPEMPLAAATASCQGFWRLGQRPSRPTFRSATENGQSALSSWHLCPAPSVSTPTGRDCLAATPPRLARDLHHALTRLLLRPHSQTSAFDTYPTKGTHRRPSRRLKSFLR